MQRGLLRSWTESHPGSKFLPLLSDARLVGEIRGLVHRLLCSRHVVEFEITLSQARPGKPILRIFPCGLFQDRNRFIASAFFIEANSRLHPRPRQTQTNGLIPRRDFMSHGEDS